MLAVWRFQLQSLAPHDPSSIMVSLSVIPNHYSPKEINNMDMAGSKVWNRAYKNGA